MLKRVLVLIGCVCALIVLVVVIWRQVPGQPSDVPLNVENLSFDFGQVRTGTQAHHDFVMHNNGSDPRIVNSVSTSCGCTSVSSSMEHVVPPHSTAILPVDVNLKGVGPFQAKVFVAFKDESSTVAVITGHCVQQVPAQLVFEASPGKTAEQQFAVRSVTSAPLQIKSLKCDDAEFEASVIPPVSATAPADPQVLVRFHPSAGGKITSHLRIETDDDVQPIKVVELQGATAAAAEVK
jgi:hypothetical protein